MSKVKFITYFILQYTITGQHLFLDMVVLKRPKRFTTKVFCIKVPDLQLTPLFKIFNMSAVR